MAIKATKQGETTRWLLNGLFETSKEYEYEIEKLQREGWTLTQADDYGDNFVLKTGDN
jgi:hypothetical protein